MMQICQDCRIASDEDVHSLVGRDILCLSHDWTGDPLSRTHIMRILARNNRVLWVNSLGYRAPTISRSDISRAFRKLMAAATPIREAEPNIFVLNPLIVPAHGRPWVRAFNQRFLAFQILRAMRRLGFRRIINWTSNPVAAVVARKLGEETLVYHCVDENTAFSGVAADALGDLERQLIHRCDAVFVTSERLYESKVRHNPRTFLVRHGVDFDHFRTALDADVRSPGDVASLPHPIIGFFGLVADWVDVDLMAEVARRFPQGSLVVLGKITTEVSSLERLPNVHLLGRRPYGDLPAYCKAFDVALMPFRVNELTLNANPLKVREYLAAGLPVVSTPIPEVEVLGQCRIADGADAFEREIRAALADPGPSLERSEAIRHESWEARIKQIARHLNEVRAEAPSDSRLAERTAMPASRGE